jgi:hypothetical protein
MKLVLIVSSEEHLDFSLREARRLLAFDGGDDVAEIWVRRELDVGVQCEWSAGLAGVWMVCGMRE